MTALATAAALLTNVWAGVIIDPTLVTASTGTPIDPAGSRTVTSEYGNISKATLNQAATGILSIQDWSGASGTTNYVSFTDTNLPDFRFTFSSSTNGLATSGNQNTNEAQVTSGTSGVIITSGTAAGSLTLTIDVGSYDSTSQVFTPGTIGLETAAFTIANVRTLSYSASFYSSTGLLYSIPAQTGAGNDDGYGYNGRSFLFAYQGDGSEENSITRIVITRDWNTNGSSAQGFDDFGFVAVPEPRSWALLGGGLVLAGITVAMRRVRSATRP